MKKLAQLLLVLAIGLTMAGCGSKVEEEIVEPEPEPLYYSAPIRIVTKSLESLEGLKQGVLGVQESFDKEYSDYVLEQLAELELTEDNIRWFGSYAEIKGLIDEGKIDAWVLPDKREETVQDFRSDYNPKEYKVLAEYEKPYFEEKQIDEKLAGSDLYSKPFMVMLNGLDGFGRESTTEWYKYRSDVNHLLVVNPELKHILIVSVPRDSYVLNIARGYYDKFTHFCQDGPENSKDSLANMLDIEIPYYCMTSFNWFVYGINQFGGITVEVPMNVHLDMDSERNVQKPQDIEKGEKHIFGEATLALARNRKYNGIVRSDYSRIRNQALILDTLIGKIARHPYILDMIGMSWLFDYLCSSNFTSEEKTTLFELAKTFEDGYTIDNYFLDGVGTYINEIYFSKTKPESIEIAKGKIDLVMNEHLEKDNPYYEEILTGYITGGAGTISDGVGTDEDLANGYIGEYYDLREVFTIE